MTKNIYDSPESEVLRESDEKASLTIKEVLFSFSGRIPRGTYWLAWLGIVVVWFLVIFVLALTGAESAAFSVVAVIAYIPIVWASLAIQIKRWHDRNKSGWWVLISFVPIIGPLWVLVENGFLVGDSGSNNYGPPAI